MPLVKLHTLPTTGFGSKDEAAASLWEQIQAMVELAKDTVLPDVDKSTLERSIVLYRALKKPKIVDEEITSLDLGSIKGDFPEIHKDCDEDLLAATAGLDFSEVRAQHTREKYRQDSVVVLPAVLSKANGTLKESQYRKAVLKLCSSYKAEGYSPFLFTVVPFDLDDFPDSGKRKGIVVFARNPANTDLQHHIIVEGSDDFSRADHDYLFKNSDLSQVLPAQLLEPGMLTEDSASYLGEESFSSKVYTGADLSDKYAILNQILKLLSGNEQEHTYSLDQVLLASSSSMSQLLSERTAALKSAVKDREREEKAKWLKSASGWAVVCDKPDLETSNPALWFDNNATTQSQELGAKQLAALYKKLPGVNAYTDEPLADIGFRKCKFDFVGDQTRKVLFTVTRKISVPAVDSPTLKEKEFSIYFETKRAAEEYCRAIRDGSIVSTEATQVDVEKRSMFYAVCDKKTEKVVCYFDNKDAAQACLIEDEQFLESRLINATLTIDFKTSLDKQIFEQYIQTLSSTGKRRDTLRRVKSSSTDDDRTLTLRGNELILFYRDLRRLGLYTGYPKLTDGHSGAAKISYDLKIYPYDVLDDGKANIYSSAVNGDKEKELDVRHEFPLDEFESYAHLIKKSISAEHGTFEHHHVKVTSLPDEERKKVKLTLFYSDKISDEPVELDLDDLDGAAGQSAADKAAQAIIDEVDYYLDLVEKSKTKEEKERPSTLIDEGHKHKHPYTDVPEDREELLARITKLEELLGKNKPKPPFYTKDIDARKFDFGDPSSGGKDRDTVAALVNKYVELFSDEAFVDKPDTDVKKGSSTVSDEDHSSGYLDVRDEEESEVAEPIYDNHQNFSYVQVTRSDTATKATAAKGLRDKINAHIDAVHAFAGFAVHGSFPLLRYLALCDSLKENQLDYLPGYDFENQCFTSAVNIDVIEDVDALKASTAVYEKGAKTTLTMHIYMKDVVNPDINVDKIYDLLSKEYADLISKNDDAKKAVHISLDDHGDIAFEIDFDKVPADQLAGLYHDIKLLERWVKLDRAVSDFQYPDAKTELNEKKYCDYLIKKANERSEHSLQLAESDSKVTYDAPDSLNSVRKVVLGLEYFDCETLVLREGTISTPTRDIDESKFWKKFIEQSRIDKKLDLIYSVAGNSAPSLNIFERFKAGHGEMDSPPPYLVVMDGDQIVRYCATHTEAKAWQKKNAGSTIECVSIVEPTDNPFAIYKNGYLYEYIDSETVTDIATYVDGLRAETPFDNYGYIKVTKASDTQTADLQEIGRLAHAIIDFRSLVLAKNIDLKKTKTLGESYLTADELTGAAAKIPNFNTYFTIKIDEDTHAAHVVLKYNALDVKSLGLDMASGKAHNLEAARTAFEAFATKVEDLRRENIYASLENLADIHKQEQTQLYAGLQGDKLTAYEALFVEAISRHKAASIEIIEGNKLFLNRGGFRSFAGLNSDDEPFVIYAAPSDDMEKAIFYPTYQAALTATGNEEGKVGCFNSSTDTKYEVVDKDGVHKGYYDAQPDGATLAEGDKVNTLTPAGEDVVFLKQALEKVKKELQTITQLCSYDSKTEYFAKDEVMVGEKVSQLFITKAIRLVEDADNKSAPKTEYAKFIGGVDDEGNIFINWSHVSKFEDLRTVQQSIMQFKTAVSELHEEEKKAASKDEAVVITASSAEELDQYNHIAGNKFRTELNSTLTRAITKDVTVPTYDITLTIVDKDTNAALLADVNVFKAVIEELQAERDKAFPIQGKKVTADIDGTQVLGTLTAAQQRYIDKDSPYLVDPSDTKNARVNVAWKSIRDEKELTEAKDAITAYYTAAAAVIAVRDAEHDNGFDWYNVISAGSLEERTTYTNVIGDLFRDAKYTGNYSVSQIASTESLSFSVKHGIDASLDTDIKTTFDAQLPSIQQLHGLHGSSVIFTDAAGDNITGKTAREIIAKVTTTTEPNIDVKYLDLSDLDATVLGDGTKFAKNRYAINVKWNEITTVEQLKAAISTVEKFKAEVAAHLSGFKAPTLFDPPLDGVLTQEQCDAYQRVLDKSAHDNGAFVKGTAYRYNYDAAKSEFSLTYDASLPNADKFASDIWPALTENALPLHQKLDFTGDYSEHRDGGTSLDVAKIRGKINEATGKNNYDKFIADPYIAGGKIKIAWGEISTEDDLKHALEAVEKFGKAVEDLQLDAAKFETVLKVPNPGKDADIKDLVTNTTDQIYNKLLPALKPLKHSSTEADGTLIYQLDKEHKDFATAQALFKRIEVIFKGFDISADDKGIGAKPLITFADTGHAARFINKWHIVGHKAIPHFDWGAITSTKDLDDLELEFVALKSLVEAKQKKITYDKIFDDLTFTSADERKALQRVLDAANSYATDVQIKATAGDNGKFTVNVNRKAAKLTNIQGTFASVKQQIDETRAAFNAVTIDVSAKGGNSDGPTINYSALNFKGYEKDLLQTSLTDKLITVSIYWPSINTAADLNDAKAALADFKIKIADKQKENRDKDLKTDTGLILGPYDTAIQRTAIKNVVDHYLIALGAPDIDASSFELVDDAAWSFTIKAKPAIHEKVKREVARLRDGAINKAMAEAKKNVSLEILSDDAKSDIAITAPVCTDIKAKMAGKENFLEANWENLLTGKKNITFNELVNWAAVTTEAHLVTLMGDLKALQVHIKDAIVSHNKEISERARGGAAAGFEWVDKGISAGSTEEVTAYQRAFINGHKRFRKGTKATDDYDVSVTGHNLNIQVRTASPHKGSITTAASTFKDSVDDLQTTLVRSIDLKLQSDTGLKAMDEATARTISNYANNKWRCAKYFKGDVSSLLDGTDKLNLVDVIDWTKIETPADIQKAKSDLGTFKTHVDAMIKDQRDRFRAGKGGGDGLPPVEVSKATKQTLVVGEKDHFGRPINYHLIVAFENKKDTPPADKPLFVNMTIDAGSGLVTRYSVHIPPHSKYKDTEVMASYSKEASRQGIGHAVPSYVTSSVQAYESIKKLDATIHKVKDIAVGSNTEEEISKAISEDQRKYPQQPRYPSPEVRHSWADAWRGGRGGFGQSNHPFGAPPGTTGFSF